MFDLADGETLEEFHAIAADAFSNLAAGFKFTGHESMEPVSAIQESIKESSPPYGSDVEKTV
jgi:hypothetical protein